MRLAELPREELAARLQGEGLLLRTGDWDVRVQSPLASVAEGLGLLYEDFPVLDAGEYADFHVSLAAGGGLRRWLRPQALFRLDGFSPFKPLPLDQAYPMFEWGMNWCICTHCHDHLLIHAAVLERDGDAVLLPAPPGSGKSTLCAALVCRGWRLLSDELALVRLGDGLVTPLPRPVSLKNASIDIIRRFAPEAILSREVHDTLKGSVAHMKPPKESVLRAGEPARVRRVVFPRWRPGAPCRLETISKASAFMRLADQCFNYAMLGLTAFEVLGDLLDSCRCHDFEYEHLEDGLSLFEAS